MASPELNLAIRRPCLTGGAEALIIADTPRSIEQLCVESGIDAGELADRSNVDELRVVAIVLGRWTPSPQERDHIAAVFGLARDQVAWGHKIPVQPVYGQGPA